MRDTLGLVKTVILPVAVILCSLFSLLLTAESGPTLLAWSFHETGRVGLYGWWARHFVESARHMFLIALLLLIPGLLAFIPIRKARGRIVIAAPLVAAILIWLYYLVSSRCSCLLAP